LYIDLVLDVALSSPLENRESPQCMFRTVNVRKEM
jgi:hypothetical protein